MHGKTTLTDQMTVYKSQVLLLYTYVLFNTIYTCTAFSLQTSAALHDCMEPKSGEDLQHGKVAELAVPSFESF